MATIRIPSSAGEMLPFCSRHSDPHKQTCFDTYAHLLVTAAAMGFHRGGNARSITCRSFFNQPGPIDLAIFRSQGLMPQMLALGMVCLVTPDAATDEIELAKLIEDLAEEGLVVMERLLKHDGVASFPLRLAEWIAKPPPQDQGIL
jgi:hypothetical protein